MNGDSARLEPTDPSGPDDARASDEDVIALLRDAEAALEAIHEYKAAREVGDAKERLISAAFVKQQQDLFASGEGQRGSQAPHGASPENA